MKDAFKDIATMVQEETRMTSADSTQEQQGRRQGHGKVAGRRRTYRKRRGASAQQGHRQKKDALPAGSTTWTSDGFLGS